MTWWDDQEMIFANIDVKSFNLKALFSSSYAGNYIPVTMLLHALTFFLFEFNDSGYHALSIMLHLINGILVYKLTLTLFKKEQLALFSLLIFLLHPLQVESVAWMSELKNVLSTCFYLAALIQWTLFLQRAANKYYLFALCFFLLGILSKPSLVIFPLILMCIEGILAVNFKSIKLYNKLPFLLFAGVFAWITIQTQRADIMLNPSHEFAFWQRLIYAGYALFAYLGNFFLPIQLSLIYPYPEANGYNYLIGVIGLILFTAPIVWCVIKKKFVPAGILAFIVLNFILVLQFIPFGEVLYADRYAYVPLIGFSWALGLGLSKLFVPQKILLLIFTCALASSSFLRLNVWSSALVLFEDILKKFPNSSVALYSAGAESMRLNLDEKAMLYFNQAAKIEPNNYKTYYNRGLLYLKNQKPNLAIQNFDRALELNNYYKVYTARATAFLQLGDVSKAIADANQSIELEKNNPKAHFVLGSAYDKLNQLNNALVEFNRAMQLDAEDAELYFKRAIVFGKQQDFRNCKNDLDVCLQLRPDFTEAYYWRGVAKVNLKQDACEDFKYAAQKNLEAAVTAYNRYCR